MRTKHSFALCLLSTAPWWLGCSVSDRSALTPPDTARSVAFAKISAKIDDPEAALLDRAQASYYTTLVRGDDGSRFDDGRATLEIIPVQGAPRVSLTMQAWDAHGKQWSSRVELPQPMSLMTNGARSMRVSGSVQAVHGAAQLQLAHQQTAGLRPTLTGSVRTTAAAFSFRTEYNIECYASPQALGIQSPRHVDSALGGVEEVMLDSHFESALCKPFAALR